MNIDLNKAYIGDININENIIYTTEDYNSSSIKKMDEVLVTGSIKSLEYDGLVMDLNIKGVMYLEDAITLELLPYPFNISVNESIDINNEYFCVENNELDLKEFAWKNIVLEIPIRVVKNENETTTLNGEGWNLNNKEEDASPFDKLNSLFDNE